MTEEQETQTQETQLQEDTSHPGKTPADHVERDQQPLDEIRKEAAAAQERAATERTMEPAAMDGPLYFYSVAEFKDWADGATQQQIHAYLNSLPDLALMCLWSDLDDEAAAQEPEPLGYLDTEPESECSARDEALIKWFDSMCTVQRYYAVGWPFYDHEQCARLTTACSDDEIAAMVHILNSETKAEREARLIEVEAPCAAELIKLQTLRQTAPPTEALAMEEKLCDTYGCELEPYRRPLDQTEAVKQAYTRLRTNAGRETCLKDSTS